MCNGEWLQEVAFTYTLIAMKTDPAGNQVMVAPLEDDHFVWRWWYHDNVPGQLN